MRYSSDKYSNIAVLVDMVRVSPDAMIFSEGVKQVLAAVNERVASGTTLDEVLSFVFKSTQDICPCDRLGLALLDHTEAFATCHWVSAAYEPVYLAQGYSEDLAMSSLSQVVEHGKMRIIPDLELYLAARPESRSTALLVREGVRSSMTCPLSVDGRAVGVLFRSSRKPGVYNNRQAALHVAIASRLAQAVEKTLLIDRLEAANRSYMEMLAFVTHELKSPLASIQMDADVLSGGYLGELPAEQHAMVDKIRAKAGFLAGLVKDYLDLAHIENSQELAERRSDVDFPREIFEPALELVLTQMQANHNRLEKDLDGELALLDCDPRLLTVVVTNLLGNAVKYSSEGGTILVKAETRSDTLRFSVRNEGPGFPKEQRDKLFKPFSRLKTPELLSRKGSGIGLYTSRRIVALHGGRMFADSELGQWAEFGFELPTAHNPAGVAKQ